MTTTTRPAARPPVRRPGPDRLEVALVAAALALATLFALPLLVPAALVVGCCWLVRPPLWLLLAASLLPGVAWALWLRHAGHDPRGVALDVATRFAGVQVAAAADLGALVLRRQSLALFAWRPYVQAVVPVLPVGLVLGGLGAFGISLHSLHDGSNRTTSNECRPLDVTALPDVPVEWAMRRVLGRRVLTMLTAPPGTGKGWWTWALLRAMQDGETCFGLPVRRPWRPRSWWRKARPLGVLWLTEEGASFKATAVEQFGIRPGLVRTLQREHVPLAERAWPLLLRRIRREARRAGCAYVVIDTIGVWCPEMEAGDAPAMMDDARRELASAGLGLLFVHHDNRKGDVRGRSNLEGAVDVLVRLRPVAGQPNARRMLTSRRYGDLDVTAALEGPRYVVEPEAPRAQAPEATANATPHPPAVAVPAVPLVPGHLVATLDVLRGAGPDGLTTTGVQVATGAATPTATRRLGALEALGLIARHGAGVKGAALIWRVTDAAAPATTNPTADPAYVTYLHSKAWTDKRLAVLARAGGHCEDCGAPVEDREMEGHHLTYERVPQEPLTDLLGLCPGCHRRRHTA